MLEILNVLDTDDWRWQCQASIDCRQAMNYVAPIILGCTVPCLGRFFDLSVCQILSNGKPTQASPVTPNVAGWSCAGMKPDGRHSRGRHRGHRRGHTSFRLHMHNHDFGSRKHISTSQPSHHKPLKNLNQQSAGYLVRCDINFKNNALSLWCFPHRISIDHSISNPRLIHPGQGSSSVSDLSRVSTEDSDNSERSDSSQVVKP